MISDQIFIGSVFIAGILSFFAPCILPILPVYISIFSGGGGIEKKIGKIKINLTVIFKTLVFVAGISISFILLGFGAGALGSIINSNIFITICGIIVILLGIHQTGLIHVSFLDREKKLSVNRSHKRDVLGTFLLGFSFSFGWSPCIGPILATVLGVSATKGQGLYGAFLMLVYSIGLMIPFLIVAIFSDILLRHVKKLNKHIEKIKVVGGIIIILMGILLMSNNLNLVSRLF